ncbi:MAG: hypothetical protein ACTSYI_13165 [Promethearchaeota archaeon]
MEEKIEIKLEEIPQISQRHHFPETTEQFLSFFSQIPLLSRIVLEKNLIVKIIAKFAF